MNPTTFRGPGRDFSPGEATRRRNPDVFGTQPSPPPSESLLRGTGEQASPMPAVAEPCEKTSDEPSKSEKMLHNQILAYCRSNGWLVIHSSMAHKTHSTLGTPDFICLLPGGRVLMAEAKTRTGKLSPAQIAFAAKAGELGHVIHCCRDITQFRNAVNLGGV